MVENSGIEWTTHTFNPWVGCTKISPACDHCYAEGWAKRTGQSDLWNGERRRTSAANWHNPVKWNRDAEGRFRGAEGLAVRPRVFCASLADVFDNQADNEWRVDLWKLIELTPYLDWQLLTKRPQNIPDMVPKVWLSGFPANVWIGTTVENQAEALKRIPALLKVPAHVRFLSCEPLLGAVDLGVQVENTADCQWMPWADKLDWVICGGESGAANKRRPMDLEWARSLRDQCAAAGMAFFMKQIDKVQSIPADLMVRQFPR